jgi:hypothetical protein
MRSDVLPWTAAVACLLFLMQSAGAFPHASVDSENLDANASSSRGILAVRGHTSGRSLRRVSPQHGAPVLRACNEAGAASSGRPRISPRPGAASEPAPADVVEAGGGAPDYDRSRRETRSLRSDATAPTVIGWLTGIMVIVFAAIFGRRLQSD